MKKLTTVLFISFLISGVVAAGTFNSALAADKRLLSIATASTGGSWYPAGGAISSIVNKYVPNTEASAHPSAASRENIRLLEEKKTDLAMVMPDVGFEVTPTRPTMRDDTVTKRKPNSVMHAAPIALMPILALPEPSTYGVRRVTRTTITTPPTMTVVGRSLCVLISPFV